MTKEKLINLSKKLFSDKDDYISSFHKNMNLYISQPDMTIRELSERSGLSFSTINTVLYGNNRDYKLSTIIGLSKALNVSIDELVGCSTMNDEERYLIQEYRSSSPRIQFLIRWFIQLQSRINTSNPSGCKQSYMIMKLLLNSSGDLIPSNEYDTILIHDCSSHCLNHVTIGIQLPCCDYMPYYSPYDHILLANDRIPKVNEDCVILSNGNCYIAQRIQTNDPQEIKCIQKNNNTILYPARREIMGYIVDIRLDEYFYQR